MNLGAVAATATVSEKGWLVIPREIRKRHGIKKGDRLKVIDCGGFIAVIPSQESPVARGLAKLPGTMAATDDLLESRAADTWREERDLPPPPRD